MCGLFIKKWYSIKILSSLKQMSKITIHTTQKNHLYILSYDELFMQLWSFLND
jgi:uncharacterized HAD superfamily protein